MSCQGAVALDGVLHHGNFVSCKFRFGILYSATYWISLVPLASVPVALQGILGCMGGGGGLVWSVLIVCEKYKWNYMKLSLTCLMTLRYNGIPCLYSMYSSRSGVLLTSKFSELARLLDRGLEIESINVKLNGEVITMFQRLEVLSMSWHFSYVTPPAWRSLEFGY